MIVFCKKLNCSLLEARNLLPRALAFAERLTELTTLYSIEIYDLSWKLKYELKNFPREPEGAFQQIKHNAALAKLRGKISGELKTMWETAVAARQTEQELFYALEVYDLPIDPAAFITTLLEALNEAGELRDPQAVRDGREIYENLAFKSGVLRPFGLQPHIYDTIESRFYYTYERKFQ